MTLLQIIIEKFQFYTQLLFQINLNELKDVYKLFKHWAH